MTRLFIISLFFLLFITACISDQQESGENNSIVSAQESAEENADTVIFQITGRKKYNPDGPDSLTIISANSKELFKIAEGGNLQYLTDTVVKMDGSNIGIITLADYFQDNQIFYVLYNPIDSVSLQSARLYLPYVGLNISQYNQLNSLTISGDSLLIKSTLRKDINLTLPLDTLVCNKEGIINFYELE